MKTFEESLIEIDNIIRRRLPDILSLAEMKSGLEDGNDLAIFNAETEIHDKIDLLKAEIKRFIINQYNIQKQFDSL